jgi:cell division FtsZ-interacting protein ZapD
MFDIIENIRNTESSIAFLEELLAQQKQLLTLQKELEAALTVAGQFDLLDHESKGIQEKIEEVSNQLQKLTTPSEVKGTSLKARDLVPVLVSNLDSEINTLVSIHCGTPQPCSECMASKDGNVFIC